MLADWGLKPIQKAAKNVFLFSYSIFMSFIGDLLSFVLEVDVDHSGSLDFDEFFDLLTSMMSSWEPIEYLGFCPNQLFSQIVMKDICT